MALLAPPAAPLAATVSPPLRGPSAGKPPVPSLVPGISIVKSVSVEITYPPLSGNHHVKGTSSGRRYLSPATLAYRMAVKAAVGLRRAPPGPLNVEYLIAPPDKRARDADNLQKVANDALTLAGFWVDDNNTVLKTGSWVWTDPVPGGRILVTVTALRVE